MISSACFCCKAGPVGTRVLTPKHIIRSNFLGMQINEAYRGKAQFDLRPKSHSLTHIQAIIRLILTQSSFGA